MTTMRIRRTKAPDLFSTELDAYFGIADYAAGDRAEEAEIGVVFGRDTWRRLTVIPWTFQQALRDYYSGIEVDEAMVRAAHRAYLGIGNINHTASGCAAC